MLHDGKLYKAGWPDGGLCAVNSAARRDFNGTDTAALMTLPPVCLKTGTDRPARSTAGDEIGSEIAIYIGWRLVAPCRHCGDFAAWATVATIV